ncbi:MAG: sulfurtransferase [Sphingomonadaceae bacterium]
MYSLKHMTVLSLGWLFSTLVGAQSLPGPVVSSTWLASHLDEVQLVDVRSNVASFMASPEMETDAKTGKKTLVEMGGHIAGAHLLDARLMRSERIINGLNIKYMIPAQMDFEKLMQGLGVNAGKPIVLMSPATHGAEVDDALRMYWQLKVYGEDNIAVLDGGMAAWLLEGRQFTLSNPASKSGNWRVLADRSARYFAGSADVRQAIATPSVNLIDARDLKSYHGLVKRDYVGGYGHIAGAKLFPTELLLKSEGGALKFMSANTYRALLQGQGIDASAPAMSYCNSGHLSSGPWFILSEMLSNPSARLYDGSLHEWTMEKNPLAGAVPLN